MLMLLARTAAQRLERMALRPCRPRLLWSRTETARRLIRAGLCRRPAFT
jgi:hypothetical protein